ncbi:MAG: DMT family transporter [Phycisphaerales bacterium]
MQTVLIVLLAALAGMILPMQPGINSMLQSKLGSAWVAALVSFSVGTLILLATVTLLRMSAKPNILPDLASIRSAPWWAWLGGLIGAIFVSSSIVLAPKLGAVLFVGAVVFGQMFSSVLLDQFGVVGYAKQPLNAGRLVGVVLILIGVALILWFSPKAKEAQLVPESATTAPQAAPGPSTSTPET